MSDADLSSRIDGLLRDVPDFPQPGVMFKDITPLLADGDAFAAVVRGMVPSEPIDLVAGVEARGFLLAGALAREIGCGLLPVRKAGKLPPPVLNRSYDLEYGSAEIEVPAGLLGGLRVLLVDDVLATGGTLRAGLDLLAEAGADVVEIAVVIELGFLAGRDKLAGGPPLRALLTL